MMRMVNRLQKREGPGGDGIEPSKGTKLTARSYERGWPIIFQNGEWVHEDTGESARDDRPCPRCGKMPTPEGYDACLGYILDAKTACCGHGISEPFISGLPAKI